MTDAPERIWASPSPNDHFNPAGEDWDSGHWDKTKEPCAVEYARVVPTSEDAADVARIAAASSWEWAERAWAAEAERDRLREKLDEIARTTTDVWVSDIARAALKGET